MPLIGAVKLSQLTAPMVRQFEDKLREDRSPAMVRRWSGRSARSWPTRRSAGWWRRTSCAVDARAAGARQGARADKRQQRQAQGRRRHPVAGRDPRHPRSLEGRWRPLLLTAIFAGLRASELRGLRWKDVDLKRNELHVRQRADRYGKMGRPSRKPASARSRLPPMLANTLREWKLACPKGELDSCSPTAAAASRATPTSLTAA